MQALPSFASDPFPTAAPRTPQVTYGLYFLILVLLGFVIQLVVTGRATQYIPTAMVKNLATSPLDGKQSNTVSGAEIPAGVIDYGLQFWCQVRDWDYRYGQKKIILRRGDPTNAGVQAPEISLSPNENTLDVSIAIHPGDSTAAASEPAPSNAGGSATGDVFTCSVENVPLQTWFPISVTVFQRNVDIYIYGKLVKSCVLPGVPRTAAGDIEVGVDGGFSGTVCDIYSQGRMLTPADAQAFNSAGTPCQGLQGGSESGVSSSLFGYNVKFGIFDSKSGKPVKQYVF